VVRDLARAGTGILYSTHYLPEIEQLDSRVVILDAGKVVLEGTVRELVGTHGESFVEMTFDRTPPAVRWGAGAAIDDVKVKVPAVNPASTVAELADAVQHHEAKLISVEIIRPSLETVFSSVVESGHNEASQEGS
jgi:ABC-2 type transport system ATP-binding protein